MRLRVAAARPPSPSYRGGGGVVGGATAAAAPGTPEDDYYFSYDPHSSPAVSSEYSITAHSGAGGVGGRPYGNGLVLRMGGYDGRRGAGPRRNDCGDDDDHDDDDDDARPGGGGGVFASASQFMILEDRSGRVPCVIKSLRTHDVLPCAVVYAPRARHGGQVPSGHRLTRRNAGGPGRRRGGLGGGAGGDRRRGPAAVIDDDDGGGMDGDAGRSEALYPWALIRKGGRTMEDECAVHLVKNDGGRKAETSGGGSGSSPSTNATTNNNGGGGGGGGSIFHPEPSFRGRHGFDERGRHTHTVVYRTTSSATAGDVHPTTESCLHRVGKKTNAKRGDAGANRDGRNGRGANYDNPTSLEEVPCCLIVRDPSDLDAVNLTIAPGIDPLLMICYLASHSKMDVECIMGGY